MITILNTSKKPVAILENYWDDEVTEQINGAYTLKFTVCIDQDKSQYIQVGNFAEVEDQWFNIVKHRRTRSEDGSVIIAVECEQVSYDLLFTLFEGGYIHTGTPSALLSLALDGTGFTVGTVQPTGLVSVELKEGTNARAVLMEIARLSSAELKFDKYTVSLLNRRGQDRGVQFALGKNLKGIVKDVNGQSGEVLTAYEVDIVELNTLPEFEGLEYFELGDTILAVDEELDINEEQRIIQYSYSPKRRINSKVVIANYISGIQDNIYRIQTTTVGKDKWMYGVKIGPEEGVVIERYDKLARSKWNADEFRMQKGNGSGSYTDSLYFDPINQQYEFTGVVRAGQFIGGQIEIGSGNNVLKANDSGFWLGHADMASAPFKVNMQGVMEAEGAKFKGEINSSVITGSQIQTSASGTFPRAELSSSDKMFSVWSSSGKGIQMEAYRSGGSFLSFIDSGVLASMSFSASSGLQILGHVGGDIEISARDIDLRASRYINVYGWSDFRNNYGQSLQDALDDIWDYIQNHTHSVTLPTHNHGNVANQNWGGTFTTSSP